VIEELDRRVAYHPEADFDAELSTPALEAMLAKQAGVLAYRERGERRLAVFQMIQPPCTTTRTASRASRWWWGACSSRAARHRAFPSCST
jgi:hypothetical protein